MQLRFCNSVKDLTEMLYIIVQIENTFHTISRIKLCNASKHNHDVLVLQG